ncbi:MAG: hypothetical protein ACREBV_02395 [Candidatus Zixiibacteriota bacterium]
MTADLSILALKIQQMKKHAKFITGLALWLLLSQGCNNNEEVIVGPDKFTINSAINLTSFEKLHPASPSFEFRCLTDSIYSCANYDIDFELDTVADTFQLTFTDIFRPAICVPPDGKAFAVVNLGELTDGTYQLPVTVNAVVALAEITVTDSTFEITGGDSTWTDFPRPILRRIPANTIWGQVGYSIMSALDSANSFFDSLASIGATPETLSMGSYGYFYFDGAGNPDSILELGSTIPATNRIPYVYTYSGDTATLHNLVTAYANQGNVVEVNVITSEGFEYRTW